MIFLITLAVLLAGFILIALAPSSGVPLLLAPGGALLVLFALVWSYILAVATHTTEISFDRRSDTVTFRHRAVLRARHETLPLAQVIGVAVERTERRFRQKDPATGKRRMVTDVAFRPTLLTPAGPHPLLTTYTNQPTATEPARAVLRWLLQDPTAEPTMVDSSPPQA
ncbi:hypothetical protein KUV38_00445 [Vannielia litorea]|uniref:hypothetical protein n=1 Tax=Vannielia litorea TaxID=1217970 RepID=UPI001C958EE5|nr:hypothetical protein [Vannielia litorea]MBY6046095.1 hypothetical protein [Vannielia litorea]